MKIYEALIDENVGYQEFYKALQDEGTGYWDGVNSTDTIQSYINDMMRNGVLVSHILKALEDNESEYDDWAIWLGDSMETPTPINSKQDLVDALGLSGEDLDREIEF